MSITKITKSKLAEIVKKTVRQSVLKEDSQFTALRSIEHLAAGTSQEFEKDIAKALGMAEPDTLQPELQGKFYAVVKAMEDEIKAATISAARKLSAFPKASSGKENEIRTLEETKTMKTDKKSKQRVEQVEESSSVIKIDKQQLWEMIQEIVKKRLAEGKGKSSDRDESWERFGKKKVASGDISKKEDEKEMNSAKRREKGDCASITKKQLSEGIKKAVRTFLSEQQVIKK